MIVPPCLREIPRLAHTQGVERALQHALVQTPRLRVGLYDGETVEGAGMIAQLGTDVGETGLGPDLGKLVPVSAVPLIQGQTPEFGLLDGRCHLNRSKAGKG